MHQAHNFASRWCRVQLILHLLYGHTVSGFIVVIVVQNHARPFSTCTEHLCLEWMCIFSCLFASCSVWVSYFLCLLAFSSLTTSPTLHPPPLIPISPLSILHNVSTSFLFSSLLSIQFDLHFIFGCPQPAQVPALQPAGPHQLPLILCTEGNDWHTCDTSLHNTPPLAVRRMCKCVM